jgi:hypothetical protein
VDRRTVAPSFLPQKNKSIVRQGLNKERDQPVAM